MSGRCWAGACAPLPSSRVISAWLFIGCNPPSFASTGWRAGLRPVTRLLQDSGSQLLHFVVHGRINAPLRLGPGAVEYLQVRRPGGPASKHIEDFDAAIDVVGMASAHRPCQLGPQSRELAFPIGRRSQLEYLVEDHGVSVAGAAVLGRSDQTALVAEQPARHACATHVADDGRRGMRGKFAFETVGHEQEQLVAGAVAVLRHIGEQIPTTLVVMKRGIDAYPSRDQVPHAFPPEGKMSSP